MEAVLFRTGSDPVIGAVAVTTKRFASSLSIIDRHGSGVLNSLKFSTRLKLSDRRSSGSRTIRRAMSESDMRYGVESFGSFAIGGRSNSGKNEEWLDESEARAMIVEREGFGTADEDEEEDNGVPGGGIGKGKELGGGRGGGFGGSGGDSGESSKLDVYYKQMLKLNPRDPLLLRNYARFLHEVVKDTERADEYYGRAILANPGDGEVLGLFAKFIWETQKDSERAKSYFDQAVRASPENCMVMGMYAKFMWENEEGDEDEDDDEDVKEMNMNEPWPISSAASLASITAY